MLRFFETSEKGKVYHRAVNNRPYILFASFPFFDTLKAAVQAAF